MTTESFKQAFDSQLKKGLTNLFYGYRVVKNGKPQFIAIMQVSTDQLDQLAETMKTAVEDKERTGVLPWFTTTE